MWLLDCLALKYGEVIDDLLPQWSGLIIKDRITLIAQKCVKGDNFPTCFEASAALVSESLILSSILLIFFA